MPRIDLKQAACIGLSAALAVGLFIGPASAGWGYNNNYNNGYNNGHDWNNNGYYNRPPPVVYNTPYQSGYYPPPVVYGGGAQINLPGVSVQIR
jgi:hypothetical protein